MVRRNDRSRPRGGRAAFRALAWSAAIWLLCAGAGASPPPAVGIDHHLHVHSPAIRDFLPAYCASPGRRRPCDPDFLDPPRLESLLASMDAAGVRRGLLMSTGYLAESPLMQPARADAAALLRAANDFTAGLARERPQRFLAFIGLNPLTPTALPEIARWRGDPAVTGIKLHLTNSGVDLRDPAHAASLAAVFRAAADAGFAIMIHLRTQRPDHGAEDVRLFLEQVLPEARGATVQVAHAGGWGGTDLATFSALGVFADAFAQDRDRHANVYFDLAAVYGDQTATADLARLAALVRRIGPDRFVAASDWPFALDLADEYGRRYPLLPLEAEEWDVIRRNTWLRAGLETP